MTTQSLHSHCYSYNMETGALIRIVRGESGYFPAESSFDNDKDIADTLNAALGVSDAERHAMEMGSMFGWSVPGANVDSWIHKTTTTARAGMESMRGAS